MALVVLTALTVLAVLAVLTALAILAAGCSGRSGRSDRWSILKFAFCFAGMLFPPSKHPETAIPPCRDAFSDGKASLHRLSCD